jgi:hypothetical protein
MVPVEKVRNKVAMQMANLCDAMRPEMILYYLY